MIPLSIIILLIYCAICYIITFFITAYLIKNDLVRKINKKLVKEQDKNMYLFTYTLFLGFAPLILPFVIYHYYFKND